MPEQAARSNTGSRAIATRTQDWRPRHAANGQRDGEANGTAPGEGNLQAVSGFSPASERAGLATAPRRTIVIRGQVADRYAVRQHSSISASDGRWMRPERAALWAVLLGLALVIAALVIAQM